MLTIEDKKQIILYIYSVYYIFTFDVLIVIYKNIYIQNTSCTSYCIYNLLRTSKYLYSDEYTCLVLGMSDDSTMKMYSLYLISRNFNARDHI